MLHFSHLPKTPRMDFSVQQMWYGYLAELIDCAKSFQMFHFCTGSKFVPSNGLQMLTLTHCVIILHCKQLVTTENPHRHIL